MGFTSTTRVILLRILQLEPLMAYLNSRKAVIITHPHKPSAVNDKLIAAVPLASYEYLAETTRAILNMVAQMSWCAIRT